MLILSKGGMIRLWNSPNVGYPTRKQGMNPDCTNSGKPSY